MGGSDGIRGPEKSQGFAHPSCCAPSNLNHPGSLYRICAALQRLQLWCAVHLSGYSLYEVPTKVRRHPIKIFLCILFFLNRPGGFSLNSMLCAFFVILSDHLFTFTFSWTKFRSPLNVPKNDCSFSVRKSILAIVTNLVRNPLHKIMFSQKAGRTRSNDVDSGSHSQESKTHADKPGSICEDEVPMF